MTRRMAPPLTRHVLARLRRSLVALVALALASSGFAHVPTGVGGGHSAHHAAYADVLPEALATLCHGIAEHALAAADGGPSGADAGWVPCPFCLLAKAAALPATLPSLVVHARRAPRPVVPRRRRARAMSPRRAHRSRAPPRISVA